ncbi:TonB-dependent receptor [Sphingomonas sp. M1-B02]|uniref:TonB-dependent receptor n=1 Tax=Sphingomonas sp. M1-B02 TaxID=3114300 RepID=UPI002240A18C|nr:TonB-dependent receptor [Sphingomonas sp. S6-11]UZK65373.1 TonB-dependent receptor [Sphingomonas sp. S6-11]
MKQALWIACSTLALAAPPAFAQDASAGQDESQIVVTAQKREQVLIDVPQSVSVVSGATLERQQAVTFQDYAKLIPGLQLEQSNPGEARIVLRGINTGGVASTVSTYIDETPFGSSSGQNNGAILAGEFDTFDVARIEVLRGPQGTLYGASSLGGVVKFVTNAPQTESIEARARGTVETTEGGELSYMGQAMVNLPVSDKIAIRGSGFYRSYGGYIDSIGTAGSDVAENINGSKSYGGRLSALLTPSEALTVRLSAVLQDFDSDAASVVDVDAATLAPLYGGLTQSQYVPEFTKVKYRLYNGTINLDLGAAELLSSTSYAIQDVTLRDDLTTAYGAALGVPSDIGMAQMTNLTKWTQELRLQSPTSDSFEWLLGGYYTHEKGGIFQRIDLFTPGTLTIDPAMPQVADIFTTSTYEEYAAFANATLHFGPRFDITVGGRYSHNSQYADQGGTGLLAPPALESESSEDVFTWSGAAKYKLSQNAALYARVAKGFRPGGPNLLPPGVPAGTPLSYKSDSLISYEVGVKAETADNSFSIDAAAFRINWTDIQLFTVINGFGLNANGGKAKSEGFEFTATARPTRGFVVSLNGAYTRARLTNDTDPNVGGLAGDTLPFTPEFNWNANADYSWNVGGETEAFVGASLRSLSKQRANFDAGFGAAYGLDRPTVPAYEVIDLRAGLDFGRFTVDIFAKNLANARGVTDVSTGGGLPVAPNGAITTGIVRPRTFGITLGAGL